MSTRLLSVHTRGERSQSDWETKVCMVLVVLRPLRREDG